MQVYEDKLKQCGYTGSMMYCKFDSLPDLTFQNCLSVWIPLTIDSGDWEASSTNYPDITKDPIFTATPGMGVMA